MRLLLLASFVAAQVGLGAASAATIEQLAVVNAKVRVDGHVYRVWVKGKIGKVYSKAAIVKPTDAMADEMVRAVKQLTSCELTEHVWVESHLEGIVNCPPRGA